MDFRNYDDMTLDQLATIREYGLERVHKVTEAMKTRAKEDQLQGTNIRRLVRLARVTPRTMYRWLEE